MRSLALLTLVSAALASPIADYGDNSDKPKTHQSAVTGKNFQQWGFLILENTDYATAEANPTFQQIQTYKKNRLLSQYFGVAHPSLPNYVASIAGTTFGITDDASPAVHGFSNPTVLDLLEKGGVSWKMYAEDYPGGCNTEATNGVPHSYAAKHVPAIYSKTVTGNPTRCANIVPGTDFEKDFEAGTLPQWWYYVPNLNNDGHDTDTAYVATYLQKNWIPRFQNPKFTKDLAMVMTYDESETYSAPNHVYAALIGDAIKGTVNNHTDATTYSHYSLIKTVEDNWGLGSLGTNDTSAKAIKI